jgi:hypothetical protein
MSILKPALVVALVVAVALGGCARRIRGSALLGDSADFRLPLGERASPRSRPRRPSGRKGRRVGGCRAVTPQAAPRSASCPGARTRSSPSG